MKVTKNKLKLPVIYDQAEKELTVAAVKFTLEEWVGFRREMDVLLNHLVSPAEWQELSEKLAWLGKTDRLPPELREYEKSKGVPSTSFIDRNFEALIKIKSGIVKHPPAELKDKYIAVIEEDPEAF